MGDIVVERCTIRVIRRGGWSWGASRDRLVESATRALPRLLARHLEQLWSDDATGEIARAVPLRLELSIEDLSFLASEASPNGDDAATDSRAGAIDAALVRALAPLVQRLRPPRRMPPPRAVTTNDTAESMTPIALVVTAWHEAGTLRGHLERFSTAALHAWWRSLAGENTPAGAAHDPALTDVPVARPARAPAGEPRTSMATSAASAPLEAVAALCPPVTAVETNASPTTSSTEVRRGYDRDRLIGELVAWAGNPVATRTRRTPARVVTPDRVLASSALALPFLLLGPLVQLGVLDVVAAAFSAAGRAGDLPAFAAGLALKVLPPPERGWRRPAASIAAATAFAATDEIPDALTALAAHTEDDLWSPLASALARPVLDAHTPEQPFVVIPVADELLLADAEGLFPIGICAPLSLPELLGSTSGAVYVPRAAAAPALLTALDAGGRWFVTDAPPVRTERWRRIAAASDERWWTNAAADDVVLAAQARASAQAAVTLGDCWRALVDERPVAPSTGARHLDRMLALTALLALAWISWTLWRTREPAHPGLALQRFADLEARLHWSDDAVDVKLPLGRRRQDLHDHRLLADVAGVPWLQPRVVRFGSA